MKSQELYKGHKGNANGVNSPVKELIIDDSTVYKKKWKSVWDEDGNEYIDYVFWDPYTWSHSPGSGIGYQEPSWSRDKLWCLHRTGGADGGKNKKSHSIY